MVSHDDNLLGALGALVIPKEKTSRFAKAFFTGLQRWIHTGATLGDVLCRDKNIQCFHSVGLPVIDGIFHGSFGACHVTQTL